MRVVENENRRPRQKLVSKLGNDKGKEASSDILKRTEKLHDGITNVGDSRPKAKGGVQDQKSEEENLTGQRIRGNERFLKALIPGRAGAT